MPILEGHTLDTATMERLVGRPVDKRLAEIRMQGHRMLIGFRWADSTYKGLIAKPRTAVERETALSGTGAVLAVGPLVGKGGGPHPVGIICDDPREVLGMTVIFGQAVGQQLKVAFETDEEFAGLYRVITDRDIWLFVPDGNV